MNFSNLILQSQHNTLLKGDVKFNYKAGELTDFVNKVQVTARLKQSEVSTNDLKHFYKEFGENQTFTINTKASGTINELKLYQFYLKGISKTSVIGDLILRKSASKNLLKDFKVYGSVKKLQTSKDDLEKLLPNVLANKLPKQIKELGEIDFAGELLATSTSVSLDGNLFTDIGEGNVVLEMKDFDKSNQATYDGHLNVYNFNLGKFLDRESLGYATFDLDVDGRGFFLKKSDTFIKGDISSLDYKGYTYKDVEVQGRIKDPVFDGEFVSNDPNFKLNFVGLVNISEDENDYNFSAKVENIDFKKINIINRDSISNLKGEIIANLKGTTIDNAYGVISFKNATYKNQNDNYVFKDFQVTSQFNDEGERKLKIDSPDIIDGEITGKFKFKNLQNLLINSFNSLYKNYEPEVYTNFCLLYTSPSPRDRG